MLLKTKKKYKPVALKVNPTPTELPQHFRIVRNHVGDPLENMPTLDPNPKPFEPPDVTPQSVARSCTRITRSG